ncbi:MAG: putative PEP-binding protein [Chlamydiia bacterium]
MKVIFSIVCLIASSMNAYGSSADTLTKIQNLIHQVEIEEISSEDALLSMGEREIDLLIKPSVLSFEKDAISIEALCLSSGAVQGVLCFDLKEIPRLKAINPSIIWVTSKISNDDLCHLSEINGIFALREDPSSHAVIVTRVSNIPLLSLPKDVEQVGKTLVTSIGILKEGDEVTLDAFNGKLFPSLYPLHYPVNSLALDRIMDWADLHAKIEVHAGADTGEEAKLGLNFGALGMDPRTEHMFFHPDRLFLFRKVILLESKSRKNLEELKELQKRDFIEMYQAMGNRPAKIRLLDPPLHEFLPDQEEAIKELAHELEVSFSFLQEKIAKLKEVNPMMGHRGIRLLLTHPEILKMQVRSIFEASLDPSVKDYQIEPYINLPMVICEKEMALAKEWIEQVKSEVEQEFQTTITYHLGAMMETPRACLMAETIAPYVDFVSFGTNDLTGQTLALSRGDIYEKFLKFYFESDILSYDPFSDLDPAVAELMQITIRKLRAADHPITIGICGEQGAQKSGVFLCHAMGIDSISCASTRIPVVKLFAAQAAILSKR